jgi:hypothetical protein
MTADIASQHASELRQMAVTTAAMTVDSLKIEGRQVTIGVYRQFLESPLVEGPRWAFRGEPVGYVNWHTAKCPQQDHLHVVWKLNGRPRRCDVARPPRKPITPISERAASAWIAHSLAAGWLPTNTFGQRSYLHVPFANGTAGMGVPKELSTCLSYWDREAGARLAVKYADLPLAFARDQIEREIAADLEDNRVQRMQYARLLVLPHLILVGR